MTRGIPESTIATREFVVPRSIPTILLITDMLPREAGTGKGERRGAVPGFVSIQPERRFPNRLRMQCRRKCQFSPQRSSFRLSRFGNRRSGAGMRLGRPTAYGLRSTGPAVFESGDECEMNHARFDVFGV